MSDRYLAECCYGSDHQHSKWEKCPFDPSREPDDLDRVNTAMIVAVWQRAEQRAVLLGDIRAFLESTVITGEHPGTDPLAALRSVAEVAAHLLTRFPSETPKEDI